VEQIKNNHIMKKHIICIMFGQKSEYWNSSLVNDGNTAKKNESAEGFDSFGDASKTLEETVKPFGEKHGWNVTYSIDEL
jgi:hypothetical protein